MDYKELLEKYNLLLDENSRLMKENDRLKVQLGIDISLHVDMLFENFQTITKNILHFLPKRLNLRRNFYLASSFFIIKWSADGKIY